MPARKTILANNEIYHVYNRGINHQPTFITKRDLDRALLTFKFYLNSNPPVKLSRYLTINKPAQLYIEEKMLHGRKNVELLAFCIMPNHFHFLTRQISVGGVSKFLANFQNSYAKYFNKKHSRNGQLFLEQFKAVHIETDEQLLHVHRYIHLNPYSSGLVRTLEELRLYNYSSLREFIQPNSAVFKNSVIGMLIKSQQKYLEFLFNQADYQKKLHTIRHLVHE